MAGEATFGNPKPLCGKKSIQRAFLPLVPMRIDPPHHYFHSDDQSTDLVIRQLWLINIQKS